MASNRKYLGIRFPFTAKDDEKFFVDAEYDPYQEIKSDLTHLLFTPTGRRLRNPAFGTNLLKYVFEPNDGKTMTDLKIEIEEVMKKYFPGITIMNVNVIKNENETHNLTIQISYQINEGTFITEDTININL